MKTKIIQLKELPLFDFQKERAKQCATLLKTADEITVAMQLGTGRFHIINEVGRLLKRPINVKMKSGACIKPDIERDFPFVRINSRRFMRKNINLL